MRSLASFVIVMAAMAYVTRAWHVLALRTVQGLFAGYGSLSVAMAAESAPREQMPQAIGLVQTTSQLMPELGGRVAAITLAAVAVFETVGPPIAAWALRFSGDAEQRRPESSEVLQPDDAAVEQTPRE